MALLFRLFSAGIILILLYFKFTRKNKRFVQLASRIPGPQPLPIFGNLLMFIRDPSNILSVVTALCDKYKFHSIKIWIFNHLIIFITDPDDAEVLLTNVNLFPKTWHYRVLHPIMGQGLFTNNDHSVWKVNRKIVTPAFHFNILKGFIPVFFEEASILVKNIQPRVETDVEHMTSLCTLDTICRTAMGVNVHSQAGQGKVFVNALKKVFEIAHTRVIRSWLMSNQLFKWSSLNRENIKACEAVLSYAEKVIMEKKKEMKLRRLNPDSDVNDVNPGAFLKIMLGDGSDGYLLTDRQLRDETVTMLIGGQETTTTEVTFTILMLALHQEIQTQVLEEIDNVFKGDKSRVPSFEDIQKLTLLERVIKETMRLYPSIPVFGRSLKEDIQLNNCSIPKGCTVYIFAYCMHRHPNSFSNPEQFNPDNFLPERCRKRSPFAYLPFSAGQRNCIGQKYALLQMKTLLSTILRNFKLSPGGDIRRMEDVTTRMETTLKCNRKIKVVFTPR